MFLPLAPIVDQVDTVVLEHDLLTFYVGGILFMFSFLAFNLEEKETVIDVLGCLIASLVWPLVIVLALYELSKR